MFVFFPNSLTLIWIVLLYHVCNTRSWITYIVIPFIIINHIYEYIYQLVCLYLLVMVIRSFCSLFPKTHSHLVISKHSSEANCAFATVLVNFSQLATLVWPTLCCVGCIISVHTKFILVQINKVMLIGLYEE